MSPAAKTFDWRDFAPVSTSRSELFLGSVPKESLDQPVLTGADPARKADHRRGVEAAVDSYVANRERRERRARWRRGRQ